MRSLFAIANVLGLLLMLFAALYVLPIAAALVYGDGAMRGFLIGAGASLLVGGALFGATRGYRDELKPRDGYLLVTLGWLLITGMAAIPLLIDMPGISFTHAYFEAMSGLSTTGSTVLNQLDALPHAVNLWRHALHWFGGMGIIVLAVAILPLLGVGGMQMYRAESPGPIKDSKLSPRITQTAKSLWLVYAGLTAACMFALLAAGMSPFDALCHAFSVMALGGFSTHDASIAYFNSPAIEFVMIVFMLIAAMNFATHFVALRKGDLRVYRRDPEARWMLVWVACSVVAISIYLRASGALDDGLSTLRQVSFALVTLATTSGFVSANYSVWPLFASMWMMFLGCVISSTGSTGGGIKLFRALILLKQSAREMFILVHPQAIAPLKIGGNVVPNRIVYSVLAFIFVYFMTAVALTFALLLSNMDFISAFTAVLGSLNNAGPGLGVVGPMHNYATLTDFQTWICIVAMFLGRIELFTVLVLFTPAFWRK
ncbi:MAG: potassium transporter TrkG [Steroidobacteraceae bacterium]